MAYNLHELNRLKWVMERSLTQTLALKYQISVQTVYQRYETTFETSDGTYKVLEVTVERGDGKKPLIARWGGISLAWDSRAVLNEVSPQTYISHTELEQRLLADRCELCGSTEEVEVHHIRALRDLRVRGRKEKPLWIQVMASRKRKTMVVCKKCHDAIHAGKPTGSIAA